MRVLSVTLGSLDLMREEFKEPIYVIFATLASVFVTFIIGGAIAWSRVIYEDIVSTRKQTTAATVDKSTQTAETKS